jgi:hypothetical protein
MTYTAKKIAIYAFPKKELSLVPISTFMCLLTIYSSYRIYSLDQSPYFPAAEWADRSWEYRNRYCVYAVPIQWYYFQADPIWPDGPFKNMSSIFLFLCRPSHLIADISTLELGFELFVFLPEVGAPSKFYPMNSSFLPK